MEREVDAAGFLPRAQKLETPTSSPTDSSREHSVSHESTGSSIPDLNQKTCGSIDARSNVKKKKKLKSGHDRCKKYGNDEVRSCPPSSNHFHVAGTKYAQFGHNNVMNIGQRITRTAPSDPADVKGHEAEHGRTLASHPLIESRRHVTIDDVITLSQFVGRDWQRLGRRLGLEMGQLDDLLTDHQGEGQREVVYRMLQQWVEKCDLQPTLGSLAEALLDVNAGLLKHLEK